MQTISLHHCNERPISIAANIAFMDQISADHELIKALVDTYEGGVPRRVATKIGVAATTINRHYNGSAVTKLSRKTVEKLREHYPEFHGWLTFGNKVRAEVSEFGDRPLEEKFGNSPLPAIPLVGSAIGMKSFDPERDIELTELDMGDVLDHVARPASLARDNEAYALTIIGESMWPRFRAGRRIIVSPKAPVSIGDDVIVQLRGNGEDRVTMVLVKELVRRSGSYIELRQFNPDVTFRVDADRVVKIHKVVGEVF